MNKRIILVLCPVVLLVTLIVACDAPDMVTILTSSEQSIRENITEPIGSELEIPGITAEDLRLLMETGESGDRYLLVDVRSEVDWDSTRLRKAINIPNVSSDLLEQQNRLTKLQLLPKDKLIIFYGDQPDDSDAIQIAQQLIAINIGHNIENVRILLQGHPRWKELRYPTKDTGA